jgi:hypothetical protein
MARIWDDEDRVAADRRIARLAAGTRRAGVCRADRPRLTGKAYLEAVTPFLGPACFDRCNRWTSSSAL